MRRRGRTARVHRQLERLESDFIARGGIKEKMFQARVEARAEPDALTCPQCGQPMRRRHSAKGEFWGCTGYPDCKGTRPVEAGETERATS